jgi:hypothetical protein
MFVVVEDYHHFAAILTVKQLVFLMRNRKLTAEFHSTQTSPGAEQKPSS